jgi:hypothetical protein
MKGPDQDNPTRGQDVITKGVGVKVVKIIAANKGSEEAILKEVYINGETRARAMIDSGAQVGLINPSFVRQNKLQIRPTKVKYIITAVNGTTEECSEELFASVIVDGERTTTTLLVAKTEGCDMILGYPWLRKYNPYIDWRTGELLFSRERTSPEELTAGGNTEVLVMATQSHSAKIAEEANKGKKEITLEELIPKEYQRYRETFEKKPAEELPPHRAYDCEIQLMEGAELRPGPIYPLPPRESEELKKMIDENLAKGFIRHSKSPIGSPVLFVSKKDGSLRMCIDYRKLNDITVKDRHPLPLTDELVNKLGEAKWFTKIDLRSGCNLVRIKEGDEWKTAFRSKYGHFEYLVMPFGLTNAPAVFQRMMNDIFRDKLDLCVVIYLDDILIFGTTLEQHIKDVTEVLERLQQYKLYAKPEKCEFHREEIEFLGLIIGKGKVKMDDGKTKAIKEWPTPRRVKDIQTFLGFANFYRRFIKGFSQKARAMNELLRKDTPWVWSEKEEKSFSSIKEAFTSAPVLPNHLR